MVYHIVLFKLKPEVTPEKLEEMMMNTRMQLLKIPEALSVKCGKRIDPTNDWEFFLAGLEHTIIAVICGGECSSAGAVFIVIRPFVLDFRVVGIS